MNSNSDSRLHGDNGIIKEKKLLREKIKNLLDSYSGEELSRMSNVINNKLLQSDLWKNAGVVFLYLSIEGEVNTWPLVESALKAGKRVALPRVNGREMIFHELLWEISEFNRETVEKNSKIFKRGKFKGIYEPTDELPVIGICDILARDVIVIVPGLAFDREKRRLGRGGGYYDRFIGSVRKNCGRDPLNPFFVALAFDFQIVRRVPSTELDQRVDVVITEREIFSGSV